MKLNDIDLDQVRLDQIIKITDLENLFDIFIDKRNNAVFNLNQTLYLNVNVDDLPEYTCTYTMHWPTISYCIYGTTRLAWVLWKINKIDVDDIFKPKEPGDKIKYLSQGNIDTIVEFLNEFDE